MRIVSSPLPAEVATLVDGRPAIVMAFDTLVDQKSLVVGLTEGVMSGPDLADLRLSDVGALIVERCRRHMQLNYPQGAVVLAGVAQVASAKQRVRQVLAHAPHSRSCCCCVPTARFTTPPSTPWASICNPRTSVRNR